MPADYKYKSQRNNKKNKTTLFGTHLEKKNIFTSICSDDFQSMKLDQIHPNGLLQHSKLSLTQQVFFLSLLYSVVVKNLGNRKITLLKVDEF